jgi:aryl-alcohol dehydrogenase-like predicted oxidoreductase
MTDAKSSPSAADEGVAPDAPAVAVPKPVVRQPMRERELGRSKEAISELALGTWGLSGDAYGPVYHKEVDRVIDRAIELGITLFDTAPSYGDGRMEEKLGAMLDPEIHRVVTKIGTVKDGASAQKKFDVASLREAFDQSRARLKRDKLDIVLLHNPSAAALERREASDWLAERVKAGELNHWGVSAGNGEIARVAIERGAMVIELAYNVFHQRDLHGLAGEIAATETAVLARSVLAHGLLAGHWPKTKVFFDNDHRSQRWTKEQVQYRMEQLGAVRQLVGDDVLTLRAAAVRFVLENQLVSSAILGPRSVTQLNPLVHEVGKGPPYLKSEELAALPARLEAVGIAL